MDSFYNIKDVAEKLNVHWKTVYRWILNGNINAIKIGRVYKISHQELEYIKQNGLRSKDNETNS